MKRVDRAFFRRATGSPFADDLLFCYRRRKGNRDLRNSERQSYDQWQRFSHFHFRKGMLRLRICTHVTPRGTVFVNFKARRDISSTQMGAPPPNLRQLQKPNPHTACCALLAHQPRRHRQQQRGSRCGRITVRTFPQVGSKFPNQVARPLNFYFKSVAAFASANAFARALTVPGTSSNYTLEMFSLFIGVIGVAIVGGVVGLFFLRSKRKPQARPKKATRAKLSRQS